MTMPKRRAEREAMAPHEIEIGDRLRPISEAGVASVMASIAHMGQIQDPLHVRRIAGRGETPARYVLIAGGHRLEAARRLEMVDVPVAVWECTDAFAQFMEIDDNLAGQELSVLDKALFLSRRKELYEQEHPEARHGGDRGNQHTGGRQNDIVSFCQSTAEAMGKSKRQVERMMNGVGSISPTEVRKLRQAPRAVALTDLQSIGRISDADARAQVIDALAEGRAKSVSQALSQLKGAPERDPVDAAFEGLSKAWARAPMAAKRRFIAEHGDELAHMIAEARD